jgi:hypothetical protein
MKYNVTLTFTEPLLGSAPANPEIYSRFVADKKAELAEEEVALLPKDIDEKGLTVFRRIPNGGGLCMMDYQIKGFLKEAARALTGKDISAVYSKINLWAFVFPRVIPIMRNGAPILKPDATMERPLRAQTMQGPRVTVTSSEILDPVAMDPCTLTFQIEVLEKGESIITGKLLHHWLSYGQYGGLGQWRSGGWGRFTFTMTPVVKPKAESTTA